MQRGSRIILTVIIFLLAINIVSALDVTYNVLDGEVLRSGQPRYEMVLYNNEQIPLSITFNTADLNWLLNEQGQSLVLSQGETKKQIVSFRQIGTSIKPGFYGIQLKIQTAVTTIDKILPARLLEYTEPLTAEFDTETIIDPRKNNIIFFKITNKNQVAIEGLYLSLKSQHLEYTQTCNIEKGEIKTFEITIPKDDNAIEGIYNAKVEVKKDDTLFIDSDATYKISRYDNIKEVVEKTGFLLVNGEKVTIKNEGNSNVERTHTKKFGSISYKLASFKPKPTRVIETEEGKTAEWIFNVGPKQDYVLEYSVDYRTPTIVVIILIALGYGISLFREKNAITIEKRVMSMHGESIHTNVHIVKVIINIRNRGTTNVNNLKVMDRVPNSIKLPTQHGLFKPSSVKSTPEGALIIWDIMNIRPGEEKVIAYRLEGKMQVIGSIRLPPAKVKYTLFGRMVLAISNSASLREK